MENEKEIDPSEVDSGAKRYRWTDLLVGPLFFLLTAAIVVWQNSRVTVLYDLSGVLEPAYRISLGDRPYLDFPFPYAPLTFLIQAAIIRIGGTVYWYHIAYSAVVAGFATLLTWRVLLGILKDSLSFPRTAAFLLTLPAAVLGIYCIFPHPFYDPDACFVILLSVFLVLWLERRGYPRGGCVVVGMLIAVPLLIKQNIGLAFIGSSMLGLLTLALIDRWRNFTVRGYFYLAVGVLAGIAIEAASMQAWVGLGNYKYWTWTFAISRRTPSAADMLSVYQDKLLPLWIGLFAVGVLLFWVNKAGRRLISIPAVILIAAPFAWPLAYLLIDQDASERAERLANVWPVALVASLVLSTIAFRRLEGVVRVLPFVLVCTAHGVFLSQQLWGSTYGIWPLLAVMLGLTILSINELTERRFGGWLLGFCAATCISLTVAGGLYIYSNERLDYVNFEDGELMHSTLPQLEGLSIRGSYLPDFEELVRYVNENIPPDDGILTLPGEDLFCYTTGRRPRFPALLFDVTNNPYSAEQIAELARDREIRWLIVKNDLQIEVDKTIDDKDHILELLKPDFKHVESLNNYEIYRRRQPGETDDEDEDDNGGDDEDESDQSAN